MNERLKNLLKFYEEDPTDPFIIYALALEYQTVDKEITKFYFEKLLLYYPDYVGTYYHAANLYLEMNIPDKADETFRKGIEVAERLKENHALRELKTAYQNFLFE